ncbi:MAG: RluA family pseudouridine synthase [Eubacteriales bacterium]|nr:RluA family pseudouridine synthase [Eubacteriales bacterium]
MREFIVASGDDGRRLEKWLLKAAPALSYAQACRFLRLKKVRVNGKVAKEGATLHAGDVVNAYLDDACFLARPRENKLLAGFRPRIDVLYEDENILLIDKRPGLRVHGDEEEKVDTLITHLQAYLYQKGEYDGTGFAPALCNRIDRFTGGIVIAAKNEAALKEMDMRIRSRQVEKFYLCAVTGRMVPPQGELKNYLLKEGKRMRVLNREAPGAQAARTRYRTLATDGDLSLLECQLLTGRTHQIRAQFAAAGHPLIGDTQYGDPKINQAHASHFQQLYSYRIVFRFTGTPGPLEYLNGQSFQVKKLHRGFEEIVRRMPE